MNRIERNTEKLGEDLKRVIHDSEELLKATSDVATDKAREVRSRLRDTLETANRSCRDLEKRTMEKAKEVDELVHEHPYTSIGIAAALGVLVGLLVTRKE